jgi:hypothetical protein
MENQLATYEQLSARLDSAMGLLRWMIHDNQDAGFREMAVEFLNGYGNGKWKLAAEPAVVNRASPSLMA